MIKCFPASLNKDLKSKFVFIFGVNSAFIADFKIFSFLPHINIDDQQLLTPIIIKRSYGTLPPNLHFGYPGNVLTGRSIFYKNHKIQWLPRKRPYRAFDFLKNHKIQCLSIGEQ